MMRTEDINDAFLSVLFSNNKIVRCSNNIEKNISEQLLTIRALVFTSPFEQAAEESTQLQKILAACKLSAEETAIIPYDTAQTWLTYRSYNNIQEVFLFGVDEKDLALNIHLSPNQAQQFDGRTWFKTLAIAALSQNQQAKNELWLQALKPHFIS
jgi:archaellum biogenesis ATPase FlaH